MIVKFCGFKTESDIKKIRKLEVDALGFIHYPHSKRHVSLKQLKYLAKIVPDHIESSSCRKSSNVYHKENN